ncbi:MAG: hypothetical protein MUC43_06125 [Pirellula sp.]|jgi:hypothetical protein|nr:hypothetical protein [Pirellula sp.]
MRRSLALGLAIAVPCLFVGCEPDKTTSTGKPANHSHDGAGHSHDGHSHEGHSHGEQGAAAKMGLKDSVAKVVELATKIKEAGEKGDFEAAHDEMHDIGHLLEELAAKAKAESKSEEEQAAMKTAADALFATISKVDEAMHENKEIKYEEVKAGFESELAAMKALLEKL